MPAIERSSKTFVVGTTGYAAERLTFGTHATVIPDQAVYVGITALVKSAPAGAVLELWLPTFGATDLDNDYYNTGKSISGTGAETWPLASWVGAQLRAKSGGTSGNMVVDATAD